MDRVDIWHEVYHQGKAGEVCDQIVRSRPVPQALLDAVMGPTPSEPRPTLTNTRSYILYCLIAGMRPIDLEEHLGLGNSTIRYHINKLKRLYQANSMPHLVAEALRKEAPG